jgi:hypothetical protein
VPKVNRRPGRATLFSAEEKAEEMRFFYERLEESTKNVFEFRAYFSAFSSAAASVLMVLQAARKRIDPDFEAWLEPRRRDLTEEDPVCGYVLKRRSESIHEGETRIRSGSVQANPEGGDVWTHFFSSGFSAEPISVPVLEACRHTLDRVCDLVSSARLAFPETTLASFPDAQSLVRDGLTVEDIEDRVGLPRGWTAGPGITVQQRLEMLADL